MKAFPTGEGDLPQFLRERIDACQGLIQLVGAAYGRKPPTVDPDDRRVSYTQFELLYAQLKGKNRCIFHRSVRRISQILTSTPAVHSARAQSLDSQPT